MKVRTSLKSQPIWMRWRTPGLSALLGIFLLLGASGVWLGLQGQEVLTQVPQWASRVKFFGGENGLRGVRVDTFNILGIPVDFLNPLVKYYIILFFIVLAIWLISRILNSPLGAVMEAIRENEKRAAACGFDVTRTKLVVFVLSAAVCGLAGSLRALHLSIVPIDSLHYLQSGQAVMMSILGGMGTFFGPFVGAAVMLYLEDVVTTFTKHWMAVIGLVFIFFVLFFPKGIWGTILSKLNLNQDSKS